MRRLAALTALTLAACGADTPADTPVDTAQPATTTTEWAQLGPATHIDRDDPTEGLDEAVDRWYATSTTARASRTRTTTTRPAPTRPRVVVPAGDIERAICAAFGDDCARAIAVARCESRLRPDAVNGVHRGLFQVSIRWHRARIERMGFTVDDMFSAGPNIAVARSIQLEQGWRPWACA